MRAAQFLAGLSIIIEIGDAEFQFAIKRAFETGRSLLSLMFSAMLEDRLQHCFGDIWNDVLKSPQADPMEIAARHLLPMKERMERMINS